MCEPQDINCQGQLYIICIVLVLGCEYTRIAPHYSSHLISHLLSGPEWEPASTPQTRVGSRAHCTCIQLLIPLLLLVKGG
ncbi:hypothetical protein M404DRAFT_999397 [Pisolithus tinctorius Marx 270]|uniref:Uncharacterized protein n=1 Tax=Pisolithus tinctorius Marx 270 TaxID=870435 RepID=A0A0C3NZA0_PISTI|nr:hypothetical protein M404DRAFT_999397 [Pisolithus tinctorius Marx 270]